MAYKKVNLIDIGALRGMVETGRFFAGSEISEDYSHDELGGISGTPDILIKVKTTAEVSSIMRYANENKIPVVVRGSGTGLVGGAVSVYGGILLDTTLMNQILELDTDNLTITLQPGVLLMELQKYCEENQLFYPPDPGEKSATIGGNISTNAGGMRAVKYGVTRDYVRGLTVVLADGEIITLGGKVVKNSSGYSLKDLMVGSEGTLGIITEAVLKLLPLPAVSISLLVPFATMEAAIGIVPQIIKARAVPTAIEYMSRETILFAEQYLGKRFPDNKHDAYILLSFDGNTVEQLLEEYSFVADICLNNGALDVYIADTQERKDSVWNARGAFLEAIKASTSRMDECDVVVPRDKIAGFIIFTHELSKKLNIRIPSFGHAGDGNLHIYICRDKLDEEEWQNKLKQAFDALYKEAARIGGLVSGEHGIGYAKKNYLDRHYGEKLMGLMKSIKSTFDPKGILNPGKII